ncbi:hypothetical protein DL98DRAFT_588293 [Cadophora sp. DSE1049]|nr:hypothetical protein DL98DRAFT_588293 [Cadophora sp. DSE1049]
MPYQCVLCGASASVHRCSTCKPFTLYCSSNCQNSDWPVHKLLCDDLALLKLKPRLTASSKIGILFPPAPEFADLTSRSPQLIWIDCPQLRHDNKIFEMPEIKPYLGAGSSGYLVENAGAQAVSCGGISNPEASESSDRQL